MSEPDDVAKARPRAGIVTAPTERGIDLMTAQEGVQPAPSMPVAHGDKARLLLSLIEEGRFSIGAATLALYGEPPNYVSTNRIYVRLAELKRRGLIEGGIREGFRVVGRLPDPAPRAASPAATRRQQRSRRAREVRKMTEPLKRLPKSERVALALLVPELTPEEKALRPKTRGECAEGLRPCPWVGCRYHLYADVQPSGNLTLNFPDLEVEQLAETCALDAAENGGEKLEVVGELCNVTRERIRQIESRALFKLQRHGGALREVAGDEAREPVRVLRDFENARREERQERVRLEREDGEREGGDE